MPSVTDDRAQPPPQTPPAAARAAVGAALNSGAASAGTKRPENAPSPAGRLHDFLAELLVEQQQLQTPVAQFAALHDFSPSALQSFSPSRLLPLSRPRAGEQYAFEVDLDACSGCKACVSACHALNGLDENETWRDTGQLFGCASDMPIVQTITSACHHCADPACLNGCPVLAYEKDPLTGIVRHLDDQCIGCQYCVLKCPYDVPKYNARLGIVRKCDLCHQRLVHGEAPACAQACPTQAIRIVVVTTSEPIVAQAFRLPDSNPASRWSPLSPAATKNSRSEPHASKLPATNNSRSISHASRASVAAADSGARLESAPDSERSGNSTVGGALRPDVELARAAVSSESRKLSAAVHSAIRTPQSAIAFPGPDPAYTRPTTRYVAARELPAGMRAADALALRPQPAHWPLVLMLTLLPWAIGLQALLLTPLVNVTRTPSPLAGGPPPAAVAGGPNGFVSYYITSPGGLLTALPLLLGALGLAAATFHLGQPLRAWRVFLGLRQSWFSREAVLFGAWFGATALATFAPHLPGAGAFAAFVGVAGLACSVMIYVDTRRTFWRTAFTAPRFVLGGAVLALATLVLAAPLTNSASDFRGNLPYYGKFAVALVLWTKLAVELASLRGESVSARLQRGPFFGVLCVRLGLAAGAVLAYAIAPSAAAEPFMAYYAKLAAPLGALLLGEVAERYLFFRAVDAPKMPGYAMR